MCGRRRAGGELRARAENSAHELNGREGAGGGRGGGGGGGGSARTWVVGVGVYVYTCVCLMAENGVVPRVCVRISVIYLSDVEQQRNYRLGTVHTSTDFGEV